MTGIIVRVSVRRIQVESYPFLIVRREGGFTVVVPQKDHFVVFRRTDKSYFVRGVVYDTCSTLLKGQELAMMYLAAKHKARPRKGNIYMLRNKLEVGVL